MPYFVMECEGEYPMTAVEEMPDLPGGAWMDGRLLKIDVPSPLVYLLDADYPGNLKAMYDIAFPIIRHDLLSALTDAGVDNLELFDAVVREPWTGKSHTDYKAFNIVGLVSGADMGSSELMGTDYSELIDIDFHSLVIDEEKAQGKLLFRLAESVSAIVVSDRVREHVEKNGIPGMVFYGPGEWSG